MAFLSLGYSWVFITDLFVQHCVWHTEDWRENIYSIVGKYSQPNPQFHKF